jgi:SAM-dependent methyltransferase
MRPELVELEAFYRSRQGQLARRLIGRQIRQLWPDLQGRSVLGIGYAAPFLSTFEPAERVLAFLPTADGDRLPTEGCGRTALVREDELPLPDRSIDRVLLVHAIECSANPGRILREVWRVLADGGRLIAIVPNRRGLWCWSERTPFGHGQPYSINQLGRSLDKLLFEVQAERGALYLPPTGSRLLHRLAVPAERLGLTLMPHFAGVVLAEAEKRIYVGAPLAAAEPKRARSYVAVPRGLVPARSRALALRRPADTDLPRAA